MALQDAPAQREPFFTLGGLDKFPEPLGDLPQFPVICSATKCVTVVFFRAICDYLRNVSGLTF